MKKANTKKVDYSYDLYDKSSHLESGKLTKEKYDEVLNSESIKLIREWQTDFGYSKLYAKQYKGANNYTLFIWKEVWK